MDTRNFIENDLTKIMNVDQDTGLGVMQYFKENPVFTNHAIESDDVRVYLKRKMTYKTIPNLEKCLSEFISDYFKNKRRDETSKIWYKARNGYNHEAFGMGFDVFNGVFSKLKFNKMGDCLIIEPPTHSQTGLVMRMYESHYLHNENYFLVGLRNCFPECKNLKFIYENNEYSKIYRLALQELKVVQEELPKLLQIKREKQSIQSLTAKFERDFKKTFNTNEEIVMPL